MVPQLLIRQGALRAEIHVGGSIDASIASAFALALARDVKTLSSGKQAINLDFEDLELDDGSAVAEAVNALRVIMQETRVVLMNAPQMLAHTLYKTGMLAGPRLALVTPRNEEPRSS